MNKISKLTYSAAVSLLFICSAAQAALIPSDLSINANVSFDTDSSSPTGNASQTGTFALTQGGVAAQSSVDDLAVTGSNPIGGLLTDINDGIGLAAQVRGDAASVVSGFYFDFDFALSNSSLLTSYSLSFLFSFNNDTSASGSDTFAQSKFNLFDASNVEFFFSDLTTDTVFGDEKNGVTPGTFGVSQSDIGSFGFNILLAPGAVTQFRGQFLIEGGDFSQDGAFAIDGQADLILSAVRPLDVPPAEVPLPASALLLLLGLGLLVPFNQRKA